jgi:hypothetical protein
LRASAFAQTRWLQFDNVTQAGDGDQRDDPGPGRTSAQLPPTAVQWPTLPITLAANQVVSLPLILTLGAAPITRWERCLTVEGQPERLKLLLDLTILIGLFWPVEAHGPGHLAGSALPVYTLQGRRAKVANAAVNLSRMHAHVERMLIALPEGDRVV